MHVVRPANYEENQMPKVFLSYSSADRKVVEEITQKLMSRGIQVWYDQWEISVGDSKFITTFHDPQAICAQVEKEYAA